MIIQCDLCEKEVDIEKANEEGWLIILSPLGEIVEVYCNICRVIVCPKGNCND